MKVPLTKKALESYLGLLGLKLIDSRYTNRGLYFCSQRSKGCKDKASVWLRALIKENSVWPICSECEQLWQGYESVYRGNIDDL